ncbi:hypothetical protein RRG08_050942 [Elysia crispata]|uniref:Uncharacterized protein n=1 Tax=Elysia crispata TaxID=231223 RepID=A0AAE0YQ88_9GAST|nr:hypothetical protein RRG08_050942 [Elysia crispata]
MNPKLWIIITLILLVLATALHITGLVAPWWIYLKTSDFRVGVGLFFRVGCEASSGDNCTNPNFPQNLPFGYNKDCLEHDSIRYLDYLKHDSIRYLDCLKHDSTLQLDCQVPNSSLPLIGTELRPYNCFDCVHEENSGASSESFIVLKSDIELSNDCEDCVHPVTLFPPKCNGKMKTDSLQPPELRGPCVVQAGSDARQSQTTPLFKPLTADGSFLN